jgi:Fe-S cluster biogenesis protein NfuA
MAEMKERVAEILAAEVAPALEMDGTHLEVLDVIESVVRLRLDGMCSRCPGTIMAVVHGLEEELRKRVPGVEYIEVVT